MATLSTGAAGSWPSPGNANLVPTVANGKVYVATFAANSSTTVCQNANVLSTCTSARRYKEHIKPSELGLKEVLAMKPGQSIFSADLWSARERLSRLDWIASAELHRRYPDAIFVTLVEKRPFALWQPPYNSLGNSLGDAKGEAPIYVVERNGRLITSHEVEKFRRLPKLVGAGAPQAAADLVDAVATHRAIAARIAAYSRISMRRWNLILDDGVVAQLPEIGWQKELDALEHLIIDGSILERDITQIDLRSPTHYFFLLKNGEKKEAERGKET